MGGMPPPPLGMKIKRARERLRWTQAQLGDRIGVSQKTIDNWEHNRRYPRSSIGALEEVLGVILADDAEPMISAELRSRIRDLTPAEREWVRGELARAERALSGQHEGPEPAPDQQQAG